MLLPLATLLCYANTRVGKEITNRRHALSHFSIPNLSYPSDYYTIEATEQASQLERTDISWPVQTTLGCPLSFHRRATLYYLLVDH